MLKYVWPLKDKTPLEHAVITGGIIAACAIAGLFVSAGIIGLWTGVVASVMVFLGREIAQAEKRGDYPPEAEGKWYCGLYIWMWDVDSIQDILWPVLVAAAALVLALLFRVLF